MKKFACFCLLVLGFNFACAQASSKNLKDESELSLGLCRPNLMWVKPASERQKILDEIKEVGAKNVQINLKGNADICIENIAYANKIGLPVNVLVSPFESHMKAGSKRREKPENLNKAFGLSSIAPAKFLADFKKWVQAIKRGNMEVVSFEVFNEINWADFNGDLLGGGIMINEGNFKAIPFAKDYMRGMKNYAEILDGMRKILDREYPASSKLKKPLLISGSCVVSDANWLQKSNASVVDISFHYKILAGKAAESGIKTDALKNVDGYSLHIYPNVEEFDVKPATSAKTVEAFVRKHLDPIFAVADKSKYVFITEFSYSSYPLRNEKNPQGARAELTKIFLDSLSQNSLRDVNWGMLHMFCFDNSENWEIKTKDGKIDKDMASVFKRAYLKH